MPTRPQHRKRKRINMNPIKYQAENVDTRFLLLYVVKNFRFLIYGILLGACLMGGLYYLNRNVWSDPVPYTAEGVLYITYADEARIGDLYINNGTWPVLVQSDGVVNYCKIALEGQGVYLDREKLKSMLSANIETDLRVVIVKTTADNEDLAVMLNGFLENAIINMSEDMVDIDHIDIYTRADSARRITLGDRTLNMSIVGAIAGFIIALISVCIGYTFDDSVYVPSHFERRFGIPVLGIMVKDFRDKSDEKMDSAGSTAKKRMDWNVRYMIENYRHILGSAKLVGVTDLALSQKTDHVMKMLERVRKELATEEVRKIDTEQMKESEALYSNEFYRIDELPPVNEDAEVVSALRSYDAVIVLVQANDHNGALIERGLDYLAKQDVKVAGAILYDADKWLLKAYTFNPLSKALNSHNMKQDEVK